jgi:NAD-dependent SIR2 family protein deacetylase
MNPARLVAEPLALWASLAARMRDYSHTVPHEGFGILRKWIARLGLDAFVLSSNVDGQFLKAGFAPDRLRDLHGSLFWWQCSVPCGGDIWPNEQEAEAILEGLALGVLPRCKHCGAVARPNVYMFRDNTYLEARSRAQDALYQSFLLRNTGLKIVAIEIGSGPHVQSIRAKTRKLMYQHGAWALRINPQDFAIKPPHLGLPMSALDALGAIDSVLYRD